MLSFEEAIVNTKYERNAHKYNLPVLNSGQSFASVLQELAKPYSAYVELIISALAHYNKSWADEIEICFIDALKSPNIIQHFIQTIFPHLLTGSYLVVRNYFTHDMPYIKIAIEAFSDYFVYAGEVESSAIFHLKIKLDDTTVDEQLRHRSISEQLQLHSIAEQRTKIKTRQYFMRLSRALLIANNGDTPRARAAWREADKDFHSIAFNNDGS